MANYLTQDDVYNYGSDLIDFTRRAAVDAVSPHLQNLDQQNAELRQRLAREQRLRLDQQVAAAIPNFQEIDRDPNWHRWLLGIDPLTGEIRQRLLNDAVASGEIARVAAFFKGFEREGGRAGAEPVQPASTSRRRPATHGKPVYSREQVAQLYDQHRRGAYRGRESEWARLENEIIAAGREGRILNPDIVTK